MRKKRIEIDSSDLVTLGVFLKDNLKCHYARSGSNMFILAAEEYYMRIDSTQLNLIVAKLEGDKIIVDLIGAGGGKGFFNFNWGSEMSFVKKALRVLNDYSEKLLRSSIKSL